jgi:uncharacterized protein YndB with AHSA1/START domain
MTTIAAPILEIKRVLNAGVERVFRAWTAREQWQSWIGPEGCRCEVTEFEPRVGGRFRLLMNLPDGRQLPVAGIFREIDPPHRVAMTWRWELGTDDSLVIISLKDIGGKTELTLRHEGLQTEENCDGHGKGWNSALNDLEKYLAGTL